MRYLILFAFFIFSLNANSEPIVIKSISHPVTYTINTKNNSNTIYAGDSASILISSGIYYHHAKLEFIDISSVQGNTIVNLYFNVKIDGKSSALNISGLLTND